MTSTQKTVVGVVVVLAIAFGLYLVGASHAPAPASPQGDTELGQTGPILYAPVLAKITPPGLSYLIYDTEAHFQNTGVIKAGSNQASLKNNTGRTLYVDQASIWWDSGTSTSSLKFFVGTSTSATYTQDYARPFAAGVRPLIDGAIRATTTSAVDSMVMSTTSTTGIGHIAVPSGAYVVIQVQDTFGCKADAACTTATSTSRNPSNIRWLLGGHYAP